MPANQPCLVCSRVPTEELTELNALLADRSLWPASALADWIIPKGALPHMVRQHGGVATATEWLSAHGFPLIPRRSVQNHFNNHVVHIAKDDKEMEDLGKMAMGKVDASLIVMPNSRPNLFLDYYSTGIQLGVYALQKLRTQIEEAERNGEKVSDRLLWQLAELGQKLASSQAQLLTRGNKLEEATDAMAGFRQGEAPLPSQRFGDHRIRTINGETRPVVDGGRADRERYNERSEQEGSPKVFDA